MSKLKSIAIAGRGSVASSRFNLDKNIPVQSAVIPENVGIGSHIRVATTMSQLKPNQMFTRPGGEKVFIFECNKRLIMGNKDYVYLYYSLDNPHDSRETTNRDKKVDLLIPKS